MPRMGLTLDQILSTAIEIADESGYESITLSLIAQKLNIKSPSLYNHVKGLDGLRKQLTIYGLQKLYDTMADSVIGKSGDDAILEVGRSYVQFARKNPGLYEATTKIDDLNDLEIKQAGDKIVTLAFRLLEVYELDQKQKIHYVRGLRSLFHGFATLERLGGFGMPVDIDESLQEVVETFMKGIQTLTLGE